MQISLIELSFSSPAIKTIEIRVKNSYNDVAQRKSLIGYHDHSREDKTSHAVTITNQIFVVPRGIAVENKFAKFPQANDCTLMYSTP